MILGELGFLYVLKKKTNVTTIIRNIKVIIPEIRFIVWFEFMTLK